MTTGSEILHTRDQKNTETWQNGKCNSKKQENREHNKFRNMTTSSDNETKNTTTSEIQHRKHKLGNVTDSKTQTASSETWRQNQRHGKQIQKHARKPKQNNKFRKTTTKPKTQQENLGTPIQKNKKNKLTIKQQIQKKNPSMRSNWGGPRWTPHFNFDVC